jgi:hypothetical protein
MPRKTSEERVKEYEDIKALRPKVYMCKGSVVPEVFSLRALEHDARLREVRGTFRVYCLIDPRDSKPFYVGLTVVDEKKRLSQHICNAKNNGSISSGPRIKEMLKFGHRPTIKTLEVTRDRARESAWIQAMLEKGETLVNKHLRSKATHKRGATPPANAGASLFISFAGLRGLGSDFGL